MSYPRIYLQAGDAKVTWCEHRVHDSDVEYVIADPGERAPAVIASNFTCPACSTEFTVTAVPVVKEVPVDGAAPEESHAN